MYLLNMIKLLSFFNRWLCQKQQQRILNFGSIFVYCVDIRSSSGFLSKGCRVDNITIDMIDIMSCYYQGQVRMLYLALVLLYGVKFLKKLKEQIASKHSDITSRNTTCKKWESHY